MPVLLRAAHVNDVPVGASRTVKIRGAKVLLAHLPAGWYAFDASKTKLPSSPTPPTSSVHPPKAPPSGSSSAAPSSTSPWTPTAKPPPLPSKPTNASWTGLPRRGTTRGGAT